MFQVKIKKFFITFSFRFEEQNGFIVGARSVFEKAVEFFGDDHINENLFIAFARFEERQKEVLKLIYIIFFTFIKDTQYIIFFLFN